MSGAEEMKAKDLGVRGLVVCGGMHLFGGLSFITGFSFLSRELLLVLRNGGAFIFRRVRYLGVNISKKGLFFAGV